MDVRSPQPTNADLILRGGIVVTMDGGRRIFSPGSVAICGRDIVGVGPEAEMAVRFTTSQEIACQDHVIMPGLVNTHTHLPMSLLRGLADDLRLDVWLYGYILPVEREFVTPEFCFLGTQLACAEMLRGGTTCFADMYYHEEEVAWAAVQAGIRGICGETIMKLPTPDARAYEDSLRYADDFAGRWAGHELIQGVPAPHSIYMCTPEILRASAQIAERHGVPQLMHVSETAEEVDAWVANRALRPLRWLDDQGLLEGRLVAAHCVHVNEEEMLILSRHRVGVAHNPTSNLKLASGVAPVAAMLSHGIPVGIGTDGCASNNDLDMFEEMRLAALLPKGIGRSPVAVPAPSAVAMATIEGARALHLDHLIGSLEAGKRADLITVGMENAYSTPQYDTTGLNIYSHLAYAAKGSDVRDVIVNGRLVVRSGELLTLDVHRVIRQANDLARSINRFFVDREKSVLDKLVDIGGLEQQETFEVQAKGLLNDEQALQRGLTHPGLHLTQHTSRDQYDTYLLFEAGQGRLRYREDHVLQSDGSVKPLYTLTLLGPAVEAVYANSVVLTRSRYAAAADRSLRFYREYFRPREVREIAKHRERYHLRYKGLDFAINHDVITSPAQSNPYVEVMSRTWSENDAMRKAELIGELLQILGASPQDMLTPEYADLFGKD